MNKLSVKMKSILSSAGKKLSDLADSIEIEESEEPDAVPTADEEAAPSIEDVVLHISQDPRAEEEKKAEAAAELVEAEEKKEKLKKLIYIIPVVVLIILLLALIPPYVKNHNDYDAAVELLESGDYDAAKDAFSALGTYSDSAEQAEFNVDYTKACALLAAGEQGDTSALELIGKKASQLSTNEDASVVLYENAASIFSSLNGYKDSIDKLNKCLEYIDAYQEEQNASAYKAAAELLENKKYLSARDAFLALGDYSDSSDMAKECIYQRANSLLEFAKSSNVRSIYAKFSSSAAENSRISMPGSVLISIGSDTVLSLKKACGDDADILYEDSHDESLIPICEAIEQEFLSLGTYKDSAQLAEEAAETGDFTREFFKLCEAGELQAAIIWLNTYDDDFDNRDNYPLLLQTFLPYCNNWSLYSGDPTLIPRITGREDSCTDLKTSVSITENYIVLKISTLDGLTLCEMNYLPDSKGFTYSADELTLYFATINTNNNFSLTNYYNGINLGAAEYSLAG